MQALPFPSPLRDYERQARELLDAFRAGDAAALALFRQKHPRFLSDEVPWLPKPISDREIRATPLDEFDARLAVARWYDFQDWRWLRAWVEAVADAQSAVSRFEAAVEAVIHGDETALATLLAAHPDLVRARSTRVNGFDPPIHRATLLHYIAANGVESYRQRTPPNAVAIAKRLLDAGAEVDAFADMYGCHATPMSMLVSSAHPAEAGLQAALADTLLDYGAAIDGAPGDWASPLMTALVFGYRDTAEALVRRGARVDTVAIAAGLGRVDDVRRMLPGASADDRHRALALAAQHGHADVVSLLIDAGEDPNRFNPTGLHAHGTPLHHAAAGGRETVVRLLVERGARLDTHDRLWDATPLGWAVHERRDAVAAYLRSVGAC